MTELVSTRDPNQTALSYSDVLLDGLAPDGGLYVPLESPMLNLADLHRLAEASYVDLFTEVKSRLVGGSFPSDVIHDIAADAYSETNFPLAENGNVVPVTHITGNHYVQTLAGGPTAAFKDMALQPLAREMDYVLRGRGERLTLLGATSGDTGSAAEAAVAELRTLGLFMLSPFEGMTRFQKAQMGVLTGKNISNISLRAPFSPCQDLVKQIKLDPEFADLGAVNSINWGRIVSQVPYFVSGYLQTIKLAGKTIGDPVDFVVPSGNFGNMLAGYIARSIGVPIRRLIVATNENNVLHRLIQQGEYQFAETTPTTSPSMDISEASNFERLLYDLLGRDPQKVSAFMGKFKQDGFVSLGDYGVKPDALRRIDIDSGSSTKRDRIDSIRWAFNESGLVIDPHTADAVTVARSKEQDDQVPLVSMSTAMPVKFEDTIKRALGFVPDREPRFVGIEDQAAQGFVELDVSAEALKRHIHSNREAMFT